MRLALRVSILSAVLGLLTAGGSAGAQGAAPGATAPQAEGAAQPGTAGESPAKPEIVPPRLIHFENAPYPPEAQAAGLQADVVLKLTIDRDGSVSAAEVATPRGHGFDEAARDAALKFKFAPATRDGTPVVAQINYQYKFTLKEVAPPPEAQQQATTGELSGALRIAGTDTPLADTEIAIRTPDGRELRVQSDAGGRFKLPALPPGRYRVRISAPGFREHVSEETVAAGEAVDIVYRVRPESTGIEIVVEGERPAREVTRRTISRREIERIPGTSGDALRSILSLPGVGREQPFSGELIVRGSAPADTNVFFDGTLAPRIYHFGGLSSVVPTELLERIDFYPGNFSARFGRVGGGVIDVGMLTPNTRCYEDYGKESDRTGCFHGLFQVDLIDARALVQGPIGSSKEWSFAIGGRRSWIDAWAKPVLEEAGAGVTTAPVYYDYQVLVDRKARGSRFSLRFFGMDDRLKVIINDPAAQDPGFGGNLTFGNSFYRAQALYKTDLTSKVSLETMVSAGKDGFEFSLGNLLFELTTYPIYARSEFGWNVADGIKANFGLDFLTAPYDLVVRAPDPPRPGEPDPGPFVSRPLRETRESSTAFRPAWYAELELQPVERLRVVPGVRFDYARDSGHDDFSPRLNARYDLVGGATAEEQARGIERRRTTLKGGIGLFYQPPDFAETNRVFGTPNLESNRYVHYSIGVEQELTRQLDLSVEGYYKDLSNLVSRAPAGAGFAYANEGLGYVVGLETLLKYKADERFFGWVAYTLSRSVRQDDADDEEYLFQYDQTHNLIILGSYRLGRGWEAGARFRIVSGPLATPVVTPPSLPAVYAGDAGSYVALSGNPYSERLPLFHQLDIRIDKRWQFRTWKLSAYLDVQNAYSNAAVEGPLYNYDFSERTYQTGIPIIPSIGLRGEF